jgi:hypothetical protein
MSVSVPYVYRILGRAPKYTYIFTYLIPVLTLILHTLFRIHYIITGAYLFVVFYGG